MAVFEKRSASALIGDSGRLSLAVSVIALTATGALGQTSNCFNENGNPATVVCQGDQSRGINVPAGGSNPPTSSTTDLGVNALTSNVRQLNWFGGSTANSPTLNVNTGNFLLTPGGINVDRSLGVPGGGVTRLNLSGAGIFMPNASFGTTTPISAKRTGNAGASTSTNKANGGAGAGGGDIFLRFNPNQGGTVTPYQITRQTDTGPGAISAVTTGGTGGIGGQIRGNGGTSGAGGLISVATNTEVAIDVTGIGIELQSLGGAGPKGRNGQGLNGAGNAGVGGVGGLVVLNGDQNDGQGSGSWAITTTGSDAHGIFLLSEGGDGGNGGNAATSSSAPGGDARIGGNGGEVRLYQNSPITIDTSGDGAAGIVARSIGGDGGTGGSGSNLAKDGSGGSGGSAGNVNVEAAVDITTTGQDAPGIAASTVGGSTGAPGRNGRRTFEATAGIGGATFVSVDETSSVQTSGDLSTGVSVQSIGGYGSDAPNSAGLVTFAADGGSGGNSSGATAFNAGEITTTGFFAPGILAAGVGGGGGHGGKAFGLFYSAGGAGSHGGTGGVAEVNNSGTVLTGGASSTGILAQSIGGTGGAGGNSGGMVALGGGAEAGGDGTFVTVTHTGTIDAGNPERANNSTTADPSDGPCPEGCANGILAQSIGGGGGQGGSTGGWFAVGGGGESGGAGGRVTVNLGDTTSDTASIRTYLNDSDGVTAHSIGGGGGNGGNAVAVGLGVAASVGGGAGNGGAGGEVDLTQIGTEITTSGDRSHGINAQSIGGGGGNGGFAASGALGIGVGVAAAVGGSGGGGGSAAVVNVNAGQDGNRITTEGDESNAIMAQSIAGGGGSGGFAVAATGAFSPSGEGSVAISTAIGGRGSKGGSGNSVNVTSEAILSTQGDRSTGILAQSIGGGGGNGGLAVAGTFSVGEGSTGINVGVGGGAGGGGRGNTVTVTQSGALSTQGTNADGIVAHSIGGGGGNGGGAIAGSATVSGKSTSIDVSVGGGGGNGGKGGAVNVNYADSSATSGISTTGDLSDAIIAQSIGGGGGNGGFAASGNLSLGGNGNAVNVAIGGSAGSGASSNEVTVTTSASQAISATGNAAKGILAQSIAGGGGNGGMAITGSFTNGDGAKELGFALGGAGGSGGTSGAVTVNSGSAITTGSTMEYAPDALAAQQGGNAIVVQSIGGSGGTGGLAASAKKDTTSEKKGNTGDRSLTVDIGGGGGAGGTTANVIATISAGATTLGHQSDAVIAQSIGGSGGAGGGTLNYESSNKESKSLNLSIGGSGGGSAPGQSATVVVDAGARVTASGAGSRGVFVQSIGGNGGSGGANHFSVKDKNAPGDSLTVGIGGSASAASDGGIAFFEMRPGGSVRTGSGISSAPEEGSQLSGHAVTVQSIGGGGGTGGAGITGKVQTDGGDNSKSFNLGLGGQGSAGGAGGEAIVFQFDGVNQTPIEGNISTSNWNSHGLFVQSVGGGGGEGGTGINGDVSNASTLGLNIGLGAGGKGGGAGGATKVLSNANIDVSGDASKGLFAQSVGGGGGNGGIGISGDVEAGGGEGTKQLTFGLGAKGAGGGAGGAVTVENGGDIITATSAGAETGREMDALFAQSIGGGGGNGGIGINGNVTASDGSGGLELTLGIGSGGGSGGSGGAVTLSNTGALSFAGDSSRGILAQSIGGGGGNGGAGIVGDLTSASDKDGSEKKRNHINLGIGAGGGGAGTGGAVTVSNTGAIGINTASDVAATTVNATGILAQSIGGGGGNSGIGIDGAVKGTENTRVANIGIGGQGGAAGDDGGAVQVTNSGAISVIGDAGRGIHAQSIGGGGGNGALGISGTVATGSGDDEDTKEGKAISFGLGGSGGNGADGALVTVRNTGSIATGSSDTASNTENTDAHGIHAQSIGGGGGTGLVTGGLVYGNLNGEDTAKGINFNLGNTGAKGGDGGGVSVNNSSSISTAYLGSHGIFAQSIGGGGGNVGSLGGIGTGSGSVSWGATINVGGLSAKGSGGDVLVALSADTSDIFTGRGSSHGILAQSIGGGGGAGASTVGNSDASDQGKAKIALNLGGEAGSSGDGGTVTVNGGTDGSLALGNITTRGNYSVGILAQSIGGGGGLAGEALATASGSVLTLGAKGNSASVPSGDGKDVTIEFGGTIQTKAIASHGILAQSIGGGGGYGGRLFLGGDARMGSEVAMGSDGTANGGGGGVRVTLSGATVQTGVESVNSSVATSAVGIFAQSVGGGGGLRGDPNGSLDAAAIGSAGGAGISAAVTVDLNAGSTVATTAQWSHGVMAQSASGTGSNTGKVTVSLSDGSSIDAGGYGAAGIIAQTTGPATNVNSVNVSIDGTSSVRGGLGDAEGTGGSNAAIWVRDGNASNVVTNAGIIASAAGSDGIAVKYTGSAGVTVTNTGTITGSFQDNTDGASLETGTASGSSETHLVNQESGTIALGGVSTFDQITNSGRLVVANESEIGSAEITGDLVQTASGVLAVDITPDGATGDTLRIGGSAELDGQIEIFDIETAADGPILGVGAQQRSILEADGGITLADTFEVPQSAVGQVQLAESAIARGALALNFNVDFANDAIQAETNKNQDRLTEHLHALYVDDALSDDDVASLVAVETAEGYARLIDEMSAEVFLDNQIATMRSSLNFSDALWGCANAGGAVTYFDDGQCMFVSLGGGRTEREATSDNLGYDENTWSITAGVQSVLGDDWNVGAALRYEQRDLSVNNAGASSGGDQWFVGLSAKRQYGAWEFGGSVQFGHGDFDIDRRPLGVDTTGSQDISSYGAELRAAYLIDRGNWFLKPQLDLGATRVHSSAVDERGNSDFRLSVESTSETYVYLQPSLEYGGQFELKSGALLRPNLRIGLTHLLGDPDTSLSGRFASAPDGIGSFRTATSLDSTSLDLSAGVALFTSDGLAVRAVANGSFAENSREYGGAIRFEMQF